MLKDVAGFLETNSCGSLRARNLVIRCLGNWQLEERGSERNKRLAIHAKRTANFPKSPRNILGSKPYCPEHPL